jgi:outer membrane receptor protein involved in Fe transport
MKLAAKTLTMTLLLALGAAPALTAQILIRGEVIDKGYRESLIGASVIVKGTTDGTVTDFDGSFEIRTRQSLPLTLVVSYVGYRPLELIVNKAGEYLKLQLEEETITTEVVEIRGQRISDKQKASPLTVESMDLLAIRETPSDNFYDGLGSLKGVDLTAASIGFKIINTRGFNSTSPVRSLQIIDGVDNQAPGLNFSLGNFLGSPELDVLKVDLIQGASSSFYGPGAFNGVISMETKNPFLHKGLGAMVKVSERNMLETAVRWAQSVKNSKGQDWLAYKFNFSYFQARDWEAENYNPVDGTRSELGNPGRWDAVNIYGDEFFPANDFTNQQINLPSNRAGLGLFHRTGYREIDLVDYDTRNIKANTAFHFRLKPEQTYDSPELILASNFGNGTTVYQGDNRFSLRDILFFQNRIELRKRDKYFIRAYATHEDAGNSFDPYFTALRLQEAAKSNEAWAQDYSRHWQTQIFPRMRELGYPTPTVNPMTGQLIFDFDQANAWLGQFQDSLTVWHALTANAADRANPLIRTTRDFFEPGTERFQTAFDSITALKNNEGGTRFFDKSALYHIHGEYNFTPEWAERIVVGGNYRLYTPISEGTLFKDTGDVRITNQEVGAYVGIVKKFTRKWTVSGTVRVDKNENFPLLATPALSVVWSPDPLNYLRLSFSSAIRNPTLADQYLNLNVGRATLVGNLEGYDSLLTVSSLTDYLSSNFDRNKLEYFDVAPVVPEKVKTFELGYRTTLFDRLYIDAGGYYSLYDDFIGFNIGVDAEFSPFGLPTSVQAFRVAANSINRVTTRGFAIGMNYYFGNYYQLAGNYSWNRLDLNDEVANDPIIPAFNTPEHKFNISISGRNMPINLGGFRINNSGFNINYKWIDGFEFEGSPQFTGFIPGYALLDAQFNVTARRINTIFKLGASNLLNNQVFQTYGGPLVGRLAYLSITYNWENK